MTKKMERRQQDSRQLGRSEQRNAKMLGEFEDFESCVKQTVKIVARTIFCVNCNKEIATFFCPCGAFLCTLDFTSHKCLNTLRQSYNEDAIKALR
jgi:hypothetical protein